MKRLLAYFGYLWGTVDRPRSRTHLVKAEPWNREALCGVHVFGDSLTDYGDRDNVCPKCLKAFRAKEAQMAQGLMLPTRPERQGPRVVELTAQLETQERRTDAAWIRFREIESQDLLTAARREQVKLDWLYRVLEHQAGV